MKGSLTHLGWRLALLIVLPVSVATRIEAAEPSIPEHTPSFITFTNNSGDKLRVSAYGDHIFRLQRAESQHTFFADSHYEMVESHSWRTPLTLTSNADYWQVSPKANPSLIAQIDKQNFQVSFIDSNQLMLTENKPYQDQANITKVSFTYDENEHFTGLGHGYYARSNSIDLKGQKISRNYGAEPIEQAPLLVPFYMSSKGYGVFLNSTFPNTFTFGQGGDYSISYDDLGFASQLDYFFISGKKFPKILDNYTQLSGRPRLPQKAMFGLQLSDKGHDHNSATPSDEKWWKQKITEHRAAGYPLDHVINDNRWRAAGGKRCESKLDWDNKRYPNPAGYQKWLAENGLVITLDFNRCIAAKSDGWKASFNLPNIDNIQFPDSAPDLTNPEFQQWFWQVFHDKALKPGLNFPGDALWIDEFDEQGAADRNMVLSNGRSSGEMRNYWFYMIAKALVKQGWDKSGINKRPFVWVRGMTAGAQRYATLWSGDIYPNYKEMEGQIRGMQLAGLSGFPFWGHDAGGFYDWNANLGPDENLYQRWAISFGSFSPIWKPHGMGQSRWPLDRSKASQQAFKYFAHLRYALMPYIYNAAHKATATGLPMARAMVFDYQHHPKAWQHDLQYMWGDSLLIAPQTKASGDMQVWLPPQNWYEFQSSKLLKGDRTIALNPKLNELPIFVKQGSIIPTRLYAKSTAFIDKTYLGLQIYTGKNASYLLFEDDDKTEAYSKLNEARTTPINFQEIQQRLVIDPAKGNFKGENNKRDIALTFYGLSNVKQVFVNGKIVKFKWQKGALKLMLEGVAVNKETIIRWQ